MGNVMRVQRPATELAKKLKSEKKKKERRWSELSPDVLFLIFRRLFFLDQAAFRGVCQTWRSAARFDSKLPPKLLSLIFVRLSFLDQLAFRGVNTAWRSAGWIHHRSNVPQIRPVWVMKLHFDQKNTWYEFKDPSTGKTYKIDIPELGEGSRIITARGGWLLVRGKPSPRRRGHLPIFFLNPFTHARIDLPNLYVPPQVCIIEKEYVYQHMDTLRIDITAPPTSPDCIVFSIMLYLDNHYKVKYIETAICKPGRDRVWSYSIHPLPKLFRYNTGFWAMRFKKGRCESVGIVDDRLESVLFSCNPHTGRSDSRIRAGPSPITSAGWTKMDQPPPELSGSLAPMHECYKWAHDFGFVKTETDEKLFCSVNAGCCLNEVWISPTWAQPTIPGRVKASGVLSPTKKIYSLF